MSSCCQPPEPEPEAESCCGGSSRKQGEKPKTSDWLLLLSAALLISSYALSFIPKPLPDFISDFSLAVREFVHLIWWGVALGILAVGLLQHIPQRKIQSWLGEKATMSGLFRAVVAGVLFDVCSHGILLVSMQLYRKGLSLGQTMAFLIASPWNSFSLTLVLIALVGWQWTALFVVASILIAFISGILFDLLEKRGLVPSNPNHKDFTIEADDEPGFRDSISPLFRSPGGWLTFLKNAVSESRMIIRWLLLGIILAAAIRVLLPAELFSTWFGPSFLGLSATFLAATIIEVCSEGSSPIAGDLLNRAAAPGNSFAFLMAGVATDYTEIMSIRSTMKSWKIAWLLPAITIPQIVLIGWLLNQIAT